MVAWTNSTAAVAAVRRLVAGAGWRGATGSPSRCAHTLWRIAPLNRWRVFRVSAGGAACHHARQDLQTPALQWRRRSPVARTQPASHRLRSEGRWLRAAARSLPPTSRSARACHCFAVCVLSSWSLSPPTRTVAVPEQRRLAGTVPGCAAVVSCVQQGATKGDHAALIGACMACAGYV
jgi:hypothetical protein